MMLFIISPRDIRTPARYITKSISLIMTKPGRRNALPRNVAASDTVFEVAAPDTSTADATGVPAVV